MILSLRCFKLAKEQNDNAKERMGHIRIKINEAGYKEKYRRLKEQSINGIDDNNMMTEIIRQVTIAKTLMKSPVTKFHARLEELRHKEPRRKY